MRQALCVSLCVVAAGCATSEVQPLDRHARPARAPDSIGVLASPPIQPYSVIAQIESKTGAVFESYDDLRAKIVDQAAQLGGDAVIVGPESSETEFIFLVTGMIPSERKILTAEVIVFR